MNKQIVHRWRTIVIPFFISLLLVGNQGCAGQQLTNKKNDDMNLRMAVQSNGFLAIILQNNSTDTLRIWEFGNSWGWNTLTLKLKGISPDDLFVLHRRRAMIFSPNVSTFIKIDPSDEIILPLNPGDKTWESDKDLSVLIDQPIEIRGTLEIPNSPEAHEFNVFMGKVESEWIELQPPHKWLFPNSE